MLWTACDKQPDNVYLVTCQCQPWYRVTNICQQLPVLTGAFNLPMSGLKISSMTSWKNSFETPPSSIPCSPSNSTYSCFLRSCGLHMAAISNFRPRRVIRARLVQVKRKLNNEVKQEIQHQFVFRKFIKNKMLEIPLNFFQNSGSRDCHWMWCNKSVDLWKDNGVLAERIESKFSQYERGEQTTTQEL